MWYRLAVMLGTTVEEAQDRIDAQQFAEWQAYYGLEPFGGERFDIAIAQLCAIVSSALGGHGRIDDFLLFTGSRARQTSAMDYRDMQRLLMEAGL